MKRTYLMSGLVITILAGVALTGGCVTQRKYNEALAHNNRMGTELERVRESLRAGKDQNQDLTEQLGRSKLDARAAVEQLAEAEKHNTDLNLRFRKLAEEYRILARQPKLKLGDPILPDPVDKALRAFAKDNAELLEYLPKYGMVKMKADPTFNKGSDRVGNAAVTALGKFAAIVNGPAAEGLNIYIAGHTDNIPIVKELTRKKHPDNWYLSVHRAVAVQQVLVRAGITAPRIGAMGFGEHHPMEPNKAGRGGNAANRRVEIWIVPPGRYLTKDTAESD